MGLTYNKTKDRLILPRGPRDLQRRQLQQETVATPNTELLESLRAQIKLLQDQLNSSKVSDEKFNTEIADVIKKETVKHRERINKLENENTILKSTIQNSEILIEQLKHLNIADSKPETVDTERPKIEESFIDPIEKDFNNVESHIETKETVGMSKEDVVDKVGKLKKLLGKT